MDIDPSTLAVLPPAIVSNLKQYYADISGNQRPQTAGSDPGAYDH